MLNVDAKNVHSAYGFHIGQIFVGFLRGPRGPFGNSNSSVRAGGYCRPIGFVVRVQYPTGCNYLGPTDGAVRAPVVIVKDGVAERNPRRAQGQHRFYTLVSTLCQGIWFK